MDWSLQRYGRGGGIDGAGVTNLLEAAGFRTREDLLIREALQNSVDAHDKHAGHKIRVVIRKVTLRGAQKRRFAGLLRLEKLVSTPGLAASLPETNPLRRISSPEPLSLLFIEDFHTTGLGGGLVDLTGNYYRLLFVVGDGTKGTQGEDSGGSYGFGKSVYSSNSSTSTFVAFSVFETTRKTGGQYSRLLGCTLQKGGFGHLQHPWTGRGWFGRKVTGEEVPDPLVNEDAIEFAHQLGFLFRSKKERGTSLMLIGTEMAGHDLTMSGIRESIETWWWPRYLEDGIDVELYEDGIKQKSPMPRQRPDLKPYIACYSRLAAGSSDEIRVQQFNKFAGSGHSMGAVALGPVDEDLLPARDSGEPGPGARRVALVRGPMMVVQYRLFGTERRASFVGVYQAEHDINPFLRLSEPKEHHRWDPKARRLQALPFGPDIVDSVLRRCAVAVREMQASLLPQKEEPKERLEVLEGILGSLFGTNKGSKKVAERESPFSVARIEIPGGPRRIESPGMAHVESEIRVRLTEGQNSPQTLLFKPCVFLVENAGLERGDEIPITVFRKGLDKPIGGGPNPAVEVDLLSDQWTYFKIVSAPYVSDWIAKLSVTVE